MSASQPSGLYRRLYDYASRMLDSDRLALLEMNMNNQLFKNQLKTRLAGDKSLNSKLDELLTLYEKGRLLDDERILLDSIIESLVSDFYKKNKADR